MHAPGLRHRCRAVRKTARRPRRLPQSARHRPGAAVGVIPERNLASHRRGRPNRKIRRILVKIALIVLAVLLLLGMGACSKYVGVRNELVTQRESVTAAWSTVDVALQRRSDLIPNLVETVKGFAAHETEVFKNIGDARAGLGGARTPADKIAANDQLSGALSRLLVISENYPQLRSNENFLRLQDELAGTENRIAVPEDSGVCDVQILVISLIIVVLTG